MKRALLAFLAAACWGAACAAPQEKGARAIVRLLNSRAAGSPKEYAEAAEAVAAEAAKGLPVQRFLLALMAREPDAPAAARLPPEEARRYLDETRPKIRGAAANGNAMACYLLSLENNDLQMLKRAADGNNPQALNALGTITLTQALTNPGVSDDSRVRIVARSFAYFRQAAEQNDANGVYNLGMCYLNGYGVERNRAEALRLFRQAAEAGHPEAINNIGGFYREGIEVERDPAAAARWFLRSAELGNAYGQLNYALALQRGEGVARDVEKAVGVFRASAEQGNAEAMNAYGMCLFRGDGVPKDQAAAVAWYTRAARLGFPPAMENLAVCCERGAGGLEKSERAATVWKVRARAARGDSSAMAWLSKNGESPR